MKLGNALYSVILAVAVMPPVVAQQRPWLFPNFSDRLELQVSNPTDETMTTLAVIPMAEASRVALRFPGTLAVVVTPGSPVNIYPSQADDLNGDGIPDEFVFPVTLKAHEKISVDVYYSTTLHDPVPWPKQVHASHFFGYNRSTVALESEKIGYRTYGGFSLDVQARAKDHPGLNNALVGYLSASASAPSPVGRDVFHIGDTLGLGGLFLRSGEAVFRPPLNTPDYTHKPAQKEEPTYRVLADGPVRAVVEASMDHWTLGNDAVKLDAIYSIAANSEVADCRFRILPISLSRTYEVGAGIRHLPNMHSSNAIGRLALEGEQDPKIGTLGLALYFDPNEAVSAGTLKTKVGDNDIAIFRTHLEPGHAVTGHYWLAADWSGSGVHDLLAHLAEVEQQARAFVVIDGYRHSSTPTPERLQGEAY